jgi:hypothetical protein
MARAPFRERYQDLEDRRAALQVRLAMFNESAQANPAYRTAKKLLNERFRGATVAQRGSVLDSASWLIDLLMIAGSL